MTIEFQILAGGLLTEKDLRVWKHGEEKEVHHSRGADNMAETLADRYQSQQAAVVLLNAVVNDDLVATVVRVVFPLNAIADGGRVVAAVRVLVPMNAFGDNVHAATAVHADVEAVRLRAVAAVVFAIEDVAVRTIHVLEVVHRAVVDRDAIVIILLQALKVTEKNSQSRNTTFYNFKW